MVTVILMGCVIGAIGYILTETKQVNNKAEYQYIQCKLSHIETNLCLVKYLLKDIG